MKSKLKQFGYADGNYVGHCGICGCEHIADKRATVCVDCAYRKLCEHQAAEIEKLEREVQAIHEAADTIEKLMAENEQLKEELERTILQQKKCYVEFIQQEAQKGKDNG